MKKVLILILLFSLLVLAGCGGDQPKNPSNTPDTTEPSKETTQGMDFSKYKNLSIIHLGSLMLSEEAGKTFAQKVFYQNGCSHKPHCQLLYKLALPFRQVSHCKHQFVCRKYTQSHL